MQYEIQSYTNNNWHTFAMADRFGIAVDICEWQQEKHKNFPNLKFRVVEIGSQKIINV